MLGIGKTHEVEHHVTDVRSSETGVLYIRILKRTRKKTSCTNANFSFLLSLATNQLYIYIHPYKLFNVLQYYYVKKRPAHRKFSRKKNHFSRASNFWWIISPKREASKRLAERRCPRNSNWINRRHARGNLFVQRTTRERYRKVSFSVSSCNPLNASGSNSVHARATREIASLRVISL